VFIALDAHQTKDLPVDNGLFVEIPPMLGRATIIKCRSENGSNTNGWLVVMELLSLADLVRTGNTFAVK
jgi:hypothetical protein